MTTHKSRNFFLYLALISFSLIAIVTSRNSNAEEISFTTQVKPILDTKCVSCHACYDSPAQLDLTSTKGIARGAIKFDPYVPRLKPTDSTILWASPKSTEEWRKMGFFSVTEGGGNSIMAKMLRLGHDNPVESNARFPTGIDIDSLTRRNVMPNEAEIDNYVKARPLEGMPLAVTALSSEEYRVLMEWLKQGAPLENVTPQPTTAAIAKIAEWEEYLNGADNRSQLVARYIYEHANSFSVRFDDSGTFYQLIRSTTPSGKSPVPVAAKMPNDPVDGKFYYRLQPIVRTRCAKLHQLLLDASGDKLSRYKAIFNETSWDVKTLPGYSVSERWDPLNVFASIPAKARWKYLLEDIWLHRASIVWGPSCRGQLTVGSVRDQEWDFFEDPETSLYVNDAEYRAELAPYLAPPASPEDIVSFLNWLREFAEKRREVLDRAAARLAEGHQARITDIWAGEKPGDTPMISIFRNGDNAFVSKRGAAVGDFPKTSWVLDLPLLELMLYNGAVVNFDLFGDVGSWLALREGFGLLRRTAESNFLRFLPADQRQEIYDSWYGGKLTELRRARLLDFGPDTTVPTAIKFKTDDPKTEFQKMLLEHVRFTEKADPINRSVTGDSPGHLIETLRSITNASKQQPDWRKFKTLLPEATLLLIEAPGKDPRVYTMSLNRDFLTKGAATSLLQEENPSKATVTIYPGIQTAYPNFSFRIAESELDDFAKALIAAETADDLESIVKRWGVRRSSPVFWHVMQSFTDYVRRIDPLKAATFDINRYKNL
ncbi:fatty acid cis/trans isomerase [Microbulbifer sp. SAOS-129_SWC]|uniref:fatty acid cis/trans isomerase n=1 Tax=Microbulbifer sp. SAOS-129_SWC TaxID=3145235 RepID=UPI003216D219